MATKIITKYGSGAPTTSDVVRGELAVDTENGRLYTLNSSSAVVEIGVNTASNLDVTGTITADGLTVDGDVTVTGASAINLSSTQHITYQTTSTNATAGDHIFKSYNTEIMRIDGNNNRVGIGTASPNAALDVLGSSGDQLRLRTAETEEYKIGRNSSTGFLDLYGTQTGYTGYTFGGVDGERMRITSAGDVEVKGGNELRVYRTDNATYGSIEYLTGAGGLKLRDVNGDGMTFSGASSDYMSIDSSGNVGIGTSSPAQLAHLYESTAATGAFLQVEEVGGQNAYFGVNTSGGSIQVSGANPLQIATNGTERMRITSAGQTQVVGYDAMTLGFPAVAGGASRSGIKPTVTGAGDGQLQFLVGGNNVTEATTVGAMIDASGNVGIGTTTIRQRIHQHVSDSGANYHAFTNSTTGTAATDGLVVGISADEDALVWNHESANILFGTANTERMRIDSNGKIFMTEGVPFSWADSSQNVAAEIYGDSSDNLVFRNTSAKTERMRIDSSGNLLVGTTDITIYNDNADEYGFMVEPLGQMQLSANNATMLYLNHQNGDGEIISFRKDGSPVGSIGTSGGSAYIGGYQNAGLYFNGTSDVRPWNTSTQANLDNSISLGVATTGRFDDAFIVNGVTTGSDANDKQDIETLSDAEQRVAVACKGLLRKWRWKDAVEAKGDEARIHFGIIAQDLKAAFEAEGLDAGRYAMFMSNTWTDEETGEERTRLGVRYHELLAFIIAAI